ncbi:MAG: ABC transporter permease subunit [Actinobacteria bacterium]|nr:ABC transporter permease subunit [Actinomycetota bacterium]
MIRRDRLVTVALVAPATTALLLLFAGGLLGAVRQSLEPGIVGGLGGSAWSALYHDPSFRDAVRFSAEIALEATALSALIAILAALALRRHGTFARSLFALPVPVPHLLVAVIAVLWLAPGGLGDRLLGGLPVSLVGDRAGIGIVLVYVYKEAPFLALLVLAAMGRSLAEREEAAAVHGADWPQRLRWVVWPTIRKPLAAGCLIVGAFAFGAFEVPLVVGPSYPPTIATYALQATQGDLIRGQSLAAAALLVAAAASFALAAAVIRLGRGLGE